MAAVGVKGMAAAVKGMAAAVKGMAAAVKGMAAAVKGMAAAVKGMAAAVKGMASVGVKGTAGQPSSGCSGQGGSLPRRPRLADGGRAGSAAHRWSPSWQQRKTGGARL